MQDVTRNAGVSFNTAVLSFIVLVMTVLAPITLMVY